MFALKRLAPAFVIILLSALAFAQSRQQAPPPNQQGGSELSQLNRKAIEQLRAKNYDAAETTFGQILKLAPENVGTLYNMACVKALKGQSDSALEYLENAIKAGYNDYGHISRDKDLDSLRDLPGYKKILEKKEEFQKMAGERTLARLKKKFGDGYLYEVDEDDKLIFATNTDQPTLQLLKQSLIKQAKSQWNTIFEQKPDEYVSVILPTAADYAKMQPNRAIKGTYYNDSRTLISNSMGTVMTHEFTHALQCGDVNRLGQNHPVWIMEGIAVLFESSSYEGDVLTPRDNFRFPTVQGAVKSNRHVPIATMAKMPQPDFMKQAGLLYGEAGCVMMYLYDQKLIKKFFSTYKETYNKDKSGITAIEIVTGKKIAEVESDWKAWVIKRQVALVGRGQDTGQMGLSFGQADEGIRVEQIQPEGPAAQAGVQVGDIVISVDNQEPKDSKAIAPMLKNFRVGETVTLKVKRGEDMVMEIPVKLGKTTK